MIRRYSYTYFPPIPVLDISISPPEQENWNGPYEAIVDSGADFTIVPVRLWTHKMCQSSGQAHCEATC